MKEQRKSVQLAAAVEANLGEVEGKQSRFVDAGFVNTGGRDVDYAGKMLNAIKVGVDMYQGTADYKQQEREHVSNAKSYVRTHFDGIEQRMQDADIHFEDRDAFFMQEQKEQIAALDDGENGDLAQLYKRTVFEGMLNRYQALALDNQTKVKTERKKSSLALELTEINEDSKTYFEVVDSLTHNGFTESQASAVWMKGKSGQINNLTASFQGDLTKYEDAMGHKEVEILQALKASGKTKKEYLISNSIDPQLAGMGEAPIITMRELVEFELEKDGYTHPVETLDSIHNEALTTEGTDGIGPLSQLNTTEGKLLYKTVKESREKVEGIKNLIGISAHIDTGRASVEALLAATKTGNASVDALTEKKVKAALIQKTSTWLAQVFSSANNEGVDSVAAKEAGMKLDSILRMNPELASEIISSQANAFNATFRQAVDSGDPLQLQAFLMDASNSLYDTNTGQAVRDAIGKAAPGFDQAVMLNKINVDPFAILQISQGDLPQPTKEEIKASHLGETAYTDRLDEAKKAMPWASANEIVKTANLALTFDYHKLGFNDKSFFDLHGSKMSTTAMSPKKEMVAGEPRPWDDFWGGTKVPTSGYWKTLASKDAQQAGYTQGFLHYILSNTNSELKNAMVEKLGMVATEKKYKHSDATYTALNFGEGYSPVGDGNDFQPIRIRRHGVNEWSIEVTTREYLDGVWVIGDDQPYQGFILDNNEMKKYSADFDGHLSLLDSDILTQKDVDTAQRKENLALEKKDDAGYAKAVKAQQERGIIGTLMQVFKGEIDSQGKTIVYPNNDIDAPPGYYGKNKKPYTLDAYEENPYSKGIVVEDDLSEFIEEE